MLVFVFRAFLERRTPRGSSLGAPMSLHSVVSCANMKPVFALSRDLE